MLLSGLLHLSIFCFEVFYHRVQESKDLNVQFTKKPGEIGTLFNFSSCQIIFVIDSKLCHMALMCELNTLILKVAGVGSFPPKRLLTTSASASFDSNYHLEVLAPRELPPSKKKMEKMVGFICNLVVKNCPKNFKTLKEEELRKMASQVFRGDEQNDKEQREGHLESENTGQNEKAKETDEESKRNNGMSSSETKMDEERKKQDSESPKSQKDPREKRAMGEEGNPKGVAPPSNAIDLIELEKPPSTGALFEMNPLDNLLAQSDIQMDSFFSTTLAPEELVQAGRNPESSEIIGETPKPDNQENLDLDLAPLQMHSQFANNKKYLEKRTSGQSHSTDEPPKPKTTIQIVFEGFDTKSKKQKKAEGSKAKKVRINEKSDTVNPNSKKKGKAPSTSTLPHSSKASKTRERSNEEEEEMESIDLSSKKVKIEKVKEEDHGRNQLSELSFSSNMRNCTVKVAEKRVFQEEFENLLKKHRKSTSLKNKM